ncbi:MAG TPA: formimidoylglutamase, partial [Bacillus bacterium]|nr:formimidoylglutamase [Bacillus sp. (in: firmicutes)]
MGKFSFLQPGKAPVFKDRFVTKVNECVVTYSEGERGKVGLIGLPFSKSSISLSQAAEAPKTIRACLSGYSTFSGQRDQDFDDISIIDFGDVITHPTNTDETLERLYISVKEMIEKKACERYIMLGGDHGVSFPSIRAFQEKFGRIGVIQWDAHHDVRNLEDGGRTNGTPFRSLIEGGLIKGEHLVQIGIRDFANAKKYHDFTIENGVAVYSMAAIESEGILSIVRR